MDSSPPTYKEFAEMWQIEYQRRKKNPANPKAEWAYINFLKNYYHKYPSSSHKDAATAWEIERIKHKNYVKELLKIKS